MSAEVPQRKPIFPGTKGTQHLLGRIVSTHRSCGIGRHEAADLDIAAKIDIPHDGLAKRVAGVANNRLLRHLPPQAIDRNPVRAPAHVVIGAVPIRDIAAGNSGGTAHAFEPCANIIGNILILSAIYCVGDRREEDKRNKQDKSRERSHGNPPHAGSCERREGIKRKSLYDQFAARAYLSSKSRSRCRIQQLVLSARRKRPPCAQHCAAGTRTPSRAKPTCPGYLRWE